MKCEYQKVEGSGCLQTVETDAFLRGAVRLARAAGEGALSDSASRLTCIMHAAGGVKTHDGYLAEYLL
jgi:hypothetical protein